MQTPRRPAGHDKRLLLTGRIADAFLAHGVAQIPLRDLADALDTSDRMLLYYFDDKEDLVRSALAEISRRLGSLLSNSLADEQHSAAELLLRMARRLAAPAVAPYMRVWADLAARGGRGEQPFKDMARQSVEGWVVWCESRLAMPGVARRRAVASALLAVVEGVRLLESASPDSTRGALEFLSARLQPR